MAAKVIDTIRDLERDRFRAMVDGDEEALEVLLSERLWYVHTNGKRENKRQFIEAVTVGRRRYRLIEVQSQDIMAPGEGAYLVNGRALVDMAANNGGVVFTIAYTAIHVREPEGWRLLAWQATRCATE